MDEHDNVNLITTKLKEANIVTHNINNFWDEVVCGDNILLSNNKTTITKTFGINENETGYHTHILDCIGIHIFNLFIEYKEKSGKKDVIVIGITSDINGTYKNDDFTKNEKSIYYGFRSDGRKVRSPNLYQVYNKSQSNITYSVGASVTLYVNFDTNCIGFKVNNRDVGIAYDNVRINSGKCRFGVRLTTPNDSVSIESYIYCAGDINNSIIHHYRQCSDDNNNNNNDSNNDNKNIELKQSEANKTLMKKISDIISVTNQTNALKFKIQGYGSRYVNSGYGKKRGGGDKFRHEIERGRGGGRIGTRGRGRGWGGHGGPRRYSNNFNYNNNDRYDNINNNNNNNNPDIKNYMYDDELYELEREFKYQRDDHEDFCGNRSINCDYEQLNNNDKQWDCELESLRYWDDKLDRRNPDYEYWMMRYEHDLQQRLRYWHEHRNYNYNNDRYFDSYFDENHNNNYNNNYNYNYNYNSRLGGINTDAFDDMKNYDSNGGRPYRYKAQSPSQFQTQVSSRGKIGNRGGRGRGYRGRGYRGRGYRGRGDRGDRRRAGRGVNSSSYSYNSASKFNSNEYSGLNLNGNKNDHSSCNYNYIDKQEMNRKFGAVRACWVYNCMLTEFDLGINCRLFDCYERSCKKCVCNKHKHSQSIKVYQADKGIWVQGKAVIVCSWRCGNIIERRNKKAMIASAKDRQWESESENSRNGDKCVRCPITDKLITCHECSNSVCGYHAIKTPTWYYGRGDDVWNQGGFVKVCSKKCAKRVPTQNKYWESTSD